MKGFLTNFVRAVVVCTITHLASAQLITIQGRIVVAEGSTFAVNDTFTATFALSPTGIMNFTPGRYVLNAGTLMLSHKSNSYILPNTYAAGYTFENVTKGRGNITGIEFDFNSTFSEIRRFHGELYSLYPDNPQITDSEGMILENLSVGTFVSNPWAFIETTSGYYNWVPTAYSIAPNSISAVPEASMFAAVGVIALLLLIARGVIQKGTCKVAAVHRQNPLLGRSQTASGL